MAEPSQTTSEPTPIELKTKGGHTAKIKPFMSGYDDDAVKEVMMGGTNIKVKMKAAQSHQKPRTAKQEAEGGGSGGAESGQEFEIPATKSIQARHKKIEVMVLELDGSADNVLDRVQKLPVAEREEIIDKIDEIAKPLGDGEVEAEAKKALPPTMSAS